MAAGLLGVMAFAFLRPVPFALWPATHWELFSRVRTGSQVSWQVKVVDPVGGERPLPFARLGPGYRQWATIARTLPGSSPAVRAEVCRQWADGAAALLGRDEVQEVRVYRFVLRAAARAADPPRLTDGQVVVRCQPS